MGGSCQDALQRSSARALPQTAHALPQTARAGFAKRDAWGPSSNPAVVASLVGNFRVPQLREQLLQGACHLPLPVRLKVRCVCSSFPPTGIMLARDASPAAFSRSPPEVLQTSRASAGPQRSKHMGLTHAVAGCPKAAKHSWQAQAGLCFPSPSPSPGRCQVK